MASADGRGECHGGRNVGPALQRISAIAGLDLTVLGFDVQAMLRAERRTN